MDRYEHCIVEWYWGPPAGMAEPAKFKPSIVVFFAGGMREGQEGGNAELATLFTQMGHEGWRVVSGVTAFNWMHWTLERKLVA